MTDSQCFSFARRDLLCYTDTASMNVNYMQYAGRRICAKFCTNRSTDGTICEGQTNVSYIEVDETTSKQHNNILIVFNTIILRGII